jgi:hypothetical protein
MNLNINDRVAFKKWDETLNTGTITKGPFKIDRINYYHIKWDNVIQNHCPGGYETELISPMDSTKYKWKLIKKGS